MGDVTNVVSGHSRLGRETMEGRSPPRSTASYACGERERRWQDMDGNASSGDPPRGTRLQHLKKSRNHKALDCFEEPGGRGSDDEDWEWTGRETTTPKTRKKKPVKRRRQSTLALVEKHVPSTGVIGGVKWQRGGGKYKKERAEILGEFDRGKLPEQVEARKAAKRRRLNLPPEHPEEPLEVSVPGSHSDEEARFGGA